MTSARLDLRLDSRVKSKVEKASALLGANTLTEYVVRVMEEDANRVIEQHESMALEGDLFDRFVEACNKSIAPNKALLDAKSFAEEQGIK